MSTYKYTLYIIGIHLYNACIIKRVLFGNESWIRNEGRKNVHLIFITI